MKPPKQRLVERLYDPDPGKLRADVQSWLADGTTWRTMAELVSARCEYAISYESLRRWYLADAKQFAAAKKLAKAKANLPLDGLEKLTA